MTTLPMTGRAAERTAIARAWERVVADPGRPQLVVVTGAAGSGKSRLAAEALAALDPGPACVLAGRARTHSPAPYDWIASALANRDLTDLPVPPDALAWLTQRPDAPPRRLAPDALLRVAVAATRAALGPGPGVLLVEDLHDLDPASLEMVADLAAARDLPALILVTSRTPTGLAARVLARAGGTRRHLPPLTVAEVGELLAAEFGSGAGPEAVEGAWRRTGGNAFWLTELVTAYRADGPAALAAAPLTDHLVALVAGRLEGQDEATVRVARTAALLGDVAPTADLERLCGPEVEPALRRLVDLDVLTLGPDGEPGFRYPLYREAIAATALPSTRAAVRAAGSAATLTTREREVLRRVATGLTNQQVATQLGISVRTVTVHVSNVLRKTGSASRTEAALWALRHGV